MILIIAEKPSVMKNIVDAKLENAQTKRYKGYIEGKDFIYTHCIGHLLTLKYPGEIDDKYKYWNLYNLPFKFKDIPLKVSESVKEQYEIVDRLMHDSRISEIVNACDSDREGDLIFRNLYKYSHPKVSRISRMWLESQTEEGIKESFNTRLDEKEYNNVYFAGKGRSYADYIIGLNATRAMTCKFATKTQVYPIGRVQTPTLSILVDLEKEIMNFKPSNFYKIVANASCNGELIDGNYINESLDQNRFLNKDEALKMVDKIGVGEALVIEASKTEKSEKPKMLYSLSDLQVDMDKRYHMKAIDVLNTCQALYETHKLITYPRTDENHISKELANKLDPILDNLSVHKDLVNEIKTNNYKINSIMISKKDIGAHEALTPTSLSVSIDYIKKLSLDELHVYMAIVERFLAAFLPDAKIVKQKIVFVRNDESFESTFEACTYLGHRSAYTYGKKESKKKDKGFVSIKKDDTIMIEKLNLEEGTTSAPTRFTEGTLIKMMKNPVKYVEEKQDKDTLKKIEGIGTEATRASIIKELKERNLIEDYQKKYIKPTEKGIKLIDLIPDESLKSVKLTAYFEQRLDDISKGKYTCDEFLDEINDLASNFVTKVKQVDLNLIRLKETSLCSCPICKNYIVETDKGYGCSNKKCKVFIFKNARGAKLITKTQATELLTLGYTKTKVLCKAQSGKDFEAQMTYKYLEEEQYPNIIDLNFDSNVESCKETENLKDKIKPLCKCPVCSMGHIIETNYGFKCDNTSCKVNIKKNACGAKKLTKKAVTELLKDKVTSSRVDIVTKKGIDMSVYLTYSYDETLEYPNKIGILFDKEKSDD